MFKSVLFAAALFVALPVSSIFEFTVKTIDGKDKSLADYKGKVVVIVNVASECGYTPQYADLEKLYEKYKDKGLVVLGFPSNDFGGQEPGSNAQIKEFCTTKFGVKFDMFEKIPVKGDAKHPLYKFLTANATPNGEVKWNFEKFLIAKDGSIVGRFRSGVNPMSEEFTAAIEKELAKK